MNTIPVDHLSIYVIGPSSTGKTTLCNALSEKMGVSQMGYVTEIARQVMKDKGYSRDTISSVQMQQDIMEAHYAREAQLDELDCKVRVCDRSAIDPVVYAILTAKDVDEAEKRQTLLTSTEAFQLALRRYRAETSIVFLLGPVPGWLVDDGIRSTENQEKCLHVFKKLLADLDVQYHELGNAITVLEERVNFVLGEGRIKKKTN